MLHLHPSIKSYQQFSVMKINEFLKVYKNDGVVQTIAETIKPNEGGRVRLKGLSGSLDAIIAAAVYGINHQNHLFILHDKEEAAYFFMTYKTCWVTRRFYFFRPHINEPTNSMKRRIPIFCKEPKFSIVLIIKLLSGSSSFLIPKPSQSELSTKNLSPRTPLRRQLEKRLM